MMERATRAEVERAARDWVVSMIDGKGIEDLERTRLELLKRGATITRTEWSEIASSVVEDYIGPADLQRAMVHKAIVRILNTAIELLESEPLEPHHRVAAGRLALEASRQLALLVGVAQPERIEISVTVDEVSPADKMRALLAKVDATIIEAQAVETRQIELM